MSDRDSKYFNCSEEHELNQVSGKYRDREKVKAFIRKKCRDKTIHYWTHEKLAAYLAENGFQPVKAISQTEFIEGISTRFESKAQAQAAFKIVMEGIASVLKFGDNLSIKGFGTFKVEERAARKGRNPRTGEEMEIPASRTVKFTPSSVLKEQLNKEGERE